jgi:hypothetical protein
LTFKIAPHKSPRKASKTKDKGRKRRDGSKDKGDSSGNESDSSTPSSGRMSPHAGQSSDVESSNRSTRTEETPPSSPSGGHKSSAAKEWKFTQWFKKMPSQGMLPDADVLSAVEFDQSGRFLATGDRGGRIVVLEFDGSKKMKSAAEPQDSKNQAESPPPSSKRNKSQPAIHYKFHCEFQSHDPEFDYVKSLAIDERINKIKWLRPTNDAQYMLSTNGKCVS